MSVRVEHDKEAGVYNLGDDIDGVFVTFAYVDGASVDGLIASSKSAAAELAAAGGHPATDVTPQPAAEVNAGDFTDNGDGTYTRQSDGIQGRFTPAGFVPLEAA